MKAYIEEENGSISIFADVADVVVGIGNTLEEAKEDFVNSLNEVIEIHREQGNIPTELLDTNIEYAQYKMHE